MDRKRKNPQSQASTASSEEWFCSTTPTGRRPPKKQRGLERTSEQTPVGGNKNSLLEQLSSRLQSPPPKTTDKGTRARKNRAKSKFPVDFPSFSAPKRVLRDVRHAERVQVQENGSVNCVENEFRRSTNVPNSYNSPAAKAPLTATKTETPARKKSASGSCWSQEGPPTRVRIKKVESPVVLWKSPRDFGMCLPRKSLELTESVGAVPSTPVFSAEFRRKLEESPRTICQPLQPFSMVKLASPKFPGRSSAGTKPPSLFFGGDVQIEQDVFDEKSAPQPGKIESTERWIKQHSVRPLFAPPARTAFSNATPTPMRPDSKRRRSEPIQRAQESFHDQLVIVDESPLKRIHRADDELPIYESDSDEDVFREPAPSRRKDLFQQKKVASLQINAETSSRLADFHHEIVIDDNDETLKVDPIDFYVDVETCVQKNLENSDDEISSISDTTSADSVMLRRSPRKKSVIVAVDVEEGIGGSGITRKELVGLASRFSLMMTSRSARRGQLLSDVRFERSRKTVVQLEATRKTSAWGVTLSTLATGELIIQRNGEQHQPHLGESRSDPASKSPVEGAEPGTAHQPRSPAPSRVNNNISTVILQAIGPLAPPLRISRLPPIFVNPPIL